jgi:TupA-like ATPgrasp
MSTFKQILKKNILTHYLISRIDKWYFAVLYANSPVLASRYIYRRCTGKVLNLKNPKDFNEKLQWLKLYWKDPRIVKCSDKYEVREYVKKSGCEEILNQIYGVYEDTSEINWDNLPNKFVLKCTHGCGFNIICDHKDKLNKDQTFAQFDKWLKIRIDKTFAEIHYSKIKPRIICERYLETDAGFLPLDYKIYCFNGKAGLVSVCSNRAISLIYNYFDLNWEKMNITKKVFLNENLPKKPECFDEMVKYAEILSKPFPFVRVDFYIYKGKPVFGEMTFTPGAGMGLNLNEKGLQYLGEMLKLPSKNEALNSY